MTKQKKPAFDFRVNLKEIKVPVSKVQAIPLAEPMIQKVISKKRKLCELNGNDDQITSNAYRRKFVIPKLNLKIGQQEGRANNQNTKKNQMLDINFSTPNKDVKRLKLAPPRQIESQTKNLKIRLPFRGVAPKKD